MKQFFKALGVIMIVLLAVSVAINMHVILTTRSRVKNVAAYGEKGSFDCIFVLGASIINNSVPSVMLRDRLDVAIEAYKAGLAPVIIMSGDHRSDDYNEPEAMKQYAMERGVPEDAILLDHGGVSTYNSIRYLEKNFKMSRVLLVTQRYHLYRALYIAKAMDLDAGGADAALQPYSTAVFNFFREYLARIKDFGAVLLHVESSDL